MKRTPQAVTILVTVGENQRTASVLVRQRTSTSEVVREPDSDPIPRRSAVNLDSVESVSVAMLVSRLGRLADIQMRAVCAALEVAVDCPA
jgi:mRNA-degrading endonuclease toxin of MazEF toxin-antitoxin module